MPPRYGKDSPALEEGVEEDEDTAVQRPTPPVFSHRAEGLLGEVKVLRLLRMVPAHLGV